MEEMRYQLDLLKAMNQKLSIKERMYRLICDSTTNAFLYCSFEKSEVVTLGRWSDYFDFEIKDIKELTRLTEAVEASYSLALRDAIYTEKSGSEYASLECPKKGSKTWFKFQVRIIYDENKRPTDKIISIDNITKIKFQNDELTYMAYYDTLTGLYNRNYFVRLLGEFVRAASDNNSIVSVMMLDIDDFKKINDSMGIVVGDEIIQQFGSYLKEFSNEHLIVCHMSSDVYCIAISDPVGAHSVEQIYNRIKKRLKKPFVLSDGRSVELDVSFGVAEYPEASTNALELINCAEIVLFNGKRLGKNSIQYFNSRVLSDFINSVEIEKKLKEAIFNSNFILHFQPQYYIGDNKLRGVEALVRWRDGDNGMISPAVFIPIAEKNGAIIPIGNWVVEQSIKQYAEWSKKYGVHFIMSINISALQCSREDFVNGILSMIDRYSVNPSEIELEVTESILIDDFDAISGKLSKLRAHGVRISLDDFGTGFSSLSYLKRLPIDTLKIDKSFIDTVLTDSSTRIITESIISMVKTLGYEAIAEGVEDERQYRYLDSIGCDVVQGFLLGKPQPPEDIESILGNMQ
ncbi:MAG: bifunctional diguanylate cyclase/phosphodiesterase [Lachnospiraceae bacterium]|nr:bifunctional diguanylate cyclase/phosphodiesterase [Lachnospiraceae bacterium]